MHGRHFARIALVPLLLVALAGAAVRQDTPPPEQTSRDSVKPGINKSYKGDVDVEEWKERFETESREIYQQRARIARAVGLKPGETVADVGAGTGFFTMMFARAVGPDGRVFAVDIAPEFLEAIVKRTAEAGLRNVTAVLCHEDSVDLPAGSVDVVFLCDTYHHFEYPKESLASIHKALKDGGRLVVIDFERIPGESREWVLDHVRAGKGEVVREIEAAGFEMTDDGSGVDYLEENYLVSFRRRP